MRRAPVTRLLSSLFALWFALVLGDPGVLHACPEHGGSMGHGGSASHAAHQMDTQHDAPAHTGGCTCIGSCAAAPLAAPLPSVATFAVSARIVAPLAAPQYDGGVRASTADRLLPFANGPPQA